MRVASLARVEEPVRANLWHSWLPLGLPAEASRLQVRDPALAATLTDAGAEIVASGADAEIATSGDVSGTTPWAAVPVEAAMTQSRIRVARLGARAARSAVVRSRARRAAAGLRSAGYPDVSVFTWEPSLRVAPLGSPAPGLLARFPLRAVAIGRAPGTPTILDESVRAAGIGPPRSLRAKGGLAFAFGDDSVLRVAVGPGRHKLAAQRTALEQLRALDPPAGVTARLPRQLGSGWTGLGFWTAEQRLEGSPPPGPTPALLAECVDFLAGLWAAGRGAPVGPRGLRAQAERIAAVSSGEAAARVLALAERAEAELAQLPRGFAHGDFGLPNLFVRDGTLSGVADWEAAGAGALPFLDLFHLLVELELREREGVGAGFARILLPLVAAGGGPHVARYGELVGIRPTPELLRALASAYWLELIGYALATYDRGERRQRRFVAENVEGPLRALTASGWI